MSDLSLEHLLSPTSGSHRQHPSIGCYQYDLEVDDEQHDKFLTYAAKALREAYVAPEYLVEVFKREGFPGVARLFEERFPSGDNRLSISVRTGDFGEVVGHTVLQDLFGFTIPVFKIRYKTNWEKAAFGIDIIAFRVHPEDERQDTVAFAEVKTSKTKDYGVKQVFDEVELLVAEGQSEAKQKMRNAVRFVSERLFEQGHYELERRIYRFLDSYTNPHYIEAFFPFLVRDKATWNEDALDGVQLDKLDPAQVVLCIFKVGDLEKAIQVAYEVAAQAGDGVG